LAFRQRRQPRRLFARADEIQAAVRRLLRQRHQPRCALGASGKPSTWRIYCDKLYVFGGQPFRDHFKLETEQKTSHSPTRPGTAK
jgi:hypothetical protein